jgi:hypothetical protein
LIQDTDFLNKLLFEVQNMTELSQEVIKMTYDYFIKKSSTWFNNNQNQNSPVLEPFKSDKKQKRQKHLESQPLDFADRVLEIHDDFLSKAASNPIDRDFGYLSEKKPEYDTIWGEPLSFSGKRD